MFQKRIFSISTRLIGGYLILASLALAVGLVGYNQIDHINDTLVTETTERAETRYLSSKIRVESLQIASLIDQYASAESAAEKLRAQTQFEDKAFVLNEFVYQLRRGSRGSAREQALLGEILPLIQTYLDQAQLVMTASESSADNALSDQAMAQFATVRTELLEKLIAFEDEETTLVYASQQNARDTIEEARSITSILSAAALFGGLALGWIIAWTITRPVRQMTDKVRQIQAGDLAVQVNVYTKDEIGELARAFNSMTARLRERIAEIQALTDTLEQRVADRTRDLQIAADVSRQITTVLEIDKLLQQVVTLTNSSFNLYATTIFLVDNNGGRLIQTASVNSSGAYVGVAEGDAVPLDADPSIIALTARQRQAVLVNDVSVSPIYLPYAALPRTQSELAIPMVLGNQLLGVFDLQSDVAHRFAPDDLRVLTALSEQIAIAVRNAQLFAEARNAQSMAEQANQVKSKFLASMSHELRTPLNSILNFSELVVAGVLGPVNEQQVDVLQDVIDSGSHLLGLINDILDLTKIEVGMMELLIEQINVNAILDGVLSTAKGLLKDNPEIELISQIEPDLPPMAADKRRIRQVLLNLISNAIKFTPKGSITITAQRQDAAIHFTVRDTGIGIDPEDQALVFESFRQAKGGLVEGSGTGLGLPISKRIVEEHRGQMWLESQVKVGSTFHVVLPLEFQGHKASAFEIRTQE